MKMKRMRRPVLLIGAATAALLVAGCNPGSDVKNPVPGTPGPAVSPSPVISPEIANPSEAALQKLIGKWDGPEGTFITVTDKKGPDGKQQNPRRFEIEIKDLDKIEKFEGTAKGSDIEFTRKGKTETVRAATGAETGMKGFEKEANCVVVTKGSEGFCRRSGPDSPSATPSPAASHSQTPLKN